MIFKHEILEKNPDSKSPRLTRYVSTELTETFQFSFTVRVFEGKSIRVETRMAVEIFQGCISAAIMIFPFPECDIQVKGG